MPSYTPPSSDPDRLSTLETNDTKENIAHSLRKETAPAVRRVLRLFGFKFTPNPGEQPEEEPAPATMA